MKQIGVIGATGTIGREILGLLEQKEVLVRAGSRSPDQYESRADSLEWRRFDFADVASMKTFMNGLDTFFFVAPHHDPVPSVRHLLDVAAQQGVKEVVFSSGRTTGDVLGRPLHEVEELVKAGSFKWTLLRPGWFMQNFVDYLDPVPLGNRIALPVGDARTAFVDVRDIGAVAAELLENGVLHGRTLDLTSEEALDHKAVARLISRASGLKIRYEAVSEEAFAELAKVEWGWSDDEIELTIYLYRFVTDGKEEETSPDIRAVLGRAPIRFEQFAQDYAAYWKGD